MRSFIFLAESLKDSWGEADEAPITETAIVEEPTADVALLADLSDMVQRMRAFMETDTGEYALGVEMGMQRAADMIENLLRRYNEGDQVG